MHASVGISIRPRLATTTAAAHTAAGFFSRWASGSLCPVHSLSYENGIRRGIFLQGRRAFGGKFLPRGGRKRTVCVSDRQNHGLGLGLRDSAIEGRSLMVPQARRGFLSELESLRDEKEAGESVEFESPLRIVLYPDPRLRNKNKRVTIFDEKLQQLVREMFDVMYKTDGVGLAAPQVGVNVQLMLYNPEGERGKGAEYILVNPKIVKYSKQRDVFREGCLSFLHLEANVERPLSVRVEAQDIKGKKFGISLKGWQARIFQHEYDHLEGVLYHDRMTPVEIDSIRGGLVQLEEEYERKTGQSAPEKVSKVER